MVASFKTYILMVMQAIRSPGFAGLSINLRWGVSALAGKRRWPHALPPAEGQAHMVLATGSRLALPSTWGIDGPPVAPVGFPDRLAGPVRCTRWVFRVAHGRLVGVPEAMRRRVANHE
jgi:hypothetical protein